ncbi:hypothetical protein GQ457_10G007520 [Hibiscus cannabinus]
MRFGRKGKLSPRFIGPYEVIKRIGPVAYRLRLLEQLQCIHGVFHVSMLRRYRLDPLHVVPFSGGGSKDKQPFSNGSSSSSLNSSFDKGFRQKDSGTWWFHHQMVYICLYMNKKVMNDQLGGKQKRMKIRDE